MSKKLKAMGLALVALCAFGAVSAGAAQAAAPHWRTATSDPLNGTKNIREVVTLLPRVTGESPVSTELPLPPLGILHGTGLKVIGGKITGNGTIAGSNTGSATSLSFTGVTVTTAPGCGVKNVGGANGTINTSAVNAELSGESPTYALFKPSGTTVFVEIEIFKKSETETCAVSGKYKVEGTAALQILNPNKMEEYVEAESTEAIQKASGQSLTFGKKPTYLDAKGRIFLNPTELWGVHTGTP
jgi:hypothetical protein